MFPPETSDLRMASSSASSSTLPLCRRIFIRAFIASIIAPEDDGSHFTGGWSV